MKRRKYYGNLIGYTNTQAFSSRGNNDPINQMAQVDAQLAQDTLPQIEFREELRELEMQQIREQQKMNEKITNKFQKSKELGVIDPEDESKYSESGKNESNRESPESKKDGKDK